MHRKVEKWVIEYDEEHSSVAKYAQKYKKSKATKNKHENIIFPFNFPNDFIQVVFF